MATNSSCRAIFDMAFLFVFLSAQILFHFYNLSFICLILPLS